MATEQSRLRRAFHRPDQSGGIASDSHQARSAWLAFALLLGGATAALWLAGGAEQGNLGVFLLCAGLALVTCPPLQPVPRRVWWGATAWLGCASLSLLPATWFRPPTWRQTLSVVPDLALPATVSAAPGPTLFWLSVLTVTTLLGLFVLTQPVRSRGLLAFAVAGVVVCGVYSALSIYARLSGWKYAYAGGATFGFLPNRNHTATLLITGSVLAIGIFCVALRERRWLAADAAAGALALCVAGLLFFSASRAGVLFLIVGIGIWVGGLGARHLDRRLLLVVALVLLGGIGGFLAIKSDARDRLLASTQTSGKLALPARGKAPPAGETTQDDRIKIYHDTFGVIREVPWTGTGLGTFPLIFPMYRHASASNTLVLHPESDWLMLAAEMGLPALVTLGGLIFLVLQAWRPSRTHPHWPLRWACLAAAVAAVLHGIVDVPLHRAALGWWVLVLTGLALQPGRGTADSRPGGTATWVTRTVFVLGGLLSLGLGAQLIRAEWFGGVPLPPYRAAAAQANILRLYKRGDVDQAAEAARAAVLASPLASPLYYQLGVLLLRFIDTDAEAERAFQLQRLLNPLPPEISKAQGMTWLGVDPARAAARLADALARQERLPPSALGKEATVPYLQSLVAQAVGSPQTQRLLWDAAAAHGPAGMLAWLQGASAEVCNERLPALAANEEFLARLTPPQRSQFVAVWSSKGDQEALSAFLAAHGTGWVDKK